MKVAERLPEMPKEDILEIKSLCATSTFPQNPDRGLPVYFKSPNSLLNA